MSNADTPFKIGDKVIYKYGGREERKVLFIYTDLSIGDEPRAVLSGLSSTVSTTDYELIPDPIIHKREVVAKYCEARGWKYHQKQALEGDGDSFVNGIYDALVAVKDWL